MMIRRTVAAAAIVAALLAGCQKQEARQAPAPNAAAGPAVPAPAAGWTETVTETADGGFLMGNPDAPVKLVEFASLTCPHCADFAEQAYPALKEKYVAGGKVSLEVRNYVRDAADIAAVLVSRCGGAGPYFKLTEQIFATQQQWYARLQALTPQQTAALDALPEARRPAWIAEAAGLVDFARQRGIPGDKVHACLNDSKAFDRLVAMREAADKTYNITGTPTFVINGDVVGSMDWSSLEAKLKEAGA